MPADGAPFASRGASAALENARSLSRYAMIIPAKTRSFLRGAIVLGLSMLFGSAGNPSPAQANPDDLPKPGPVTFNRDIAGIIFQHCSPCHRPNQSGPFSLLTYEHARKRAQDI